MIIKKPFSVVQKFISNQALIQAKQYNSMNVLKLCIWLSFLLKVNKSFIAE